MINDNDSDPMRSESWEIPLIPINTAPIRLSQPDALAVQFGLMALGLKKLMGKRLDYSGKDDPYKNLRTSSARGVEPWRGVMVRCEDKISRRTQFMETKGDMIITDESFSDPYFDHINYICIEAGLAIEELGRFDLLEMLRLEAKDLIDIIKEIGKDIV